MGSGIFDYSAYKRAMAKKNREMEGGATDEDLQILQAKRAADDSLRLQRLRAHIPAPIALTTGGVIVPFTAIDDNPSGWTAIGSPDWQFVVPEAGQYDIAYQASFAVSTYNKNVLLYRTPAAGGAAEIIGGGSYPTTLVVSSVLLDQKFGAGDKFSLVQGVSTSASNMTSASLSIIKRSPPFA